LTHSTPLSYPSFMGSFFFFSEKGIIDSVAGPGVFALFASSLHVEGGPFFTPFVEPALFYSNTNFSRCRILRQPLSSFPLSPKSKGGGGSVREIDNT